MIFEQERGPVRVAAGLFVGGEGDDNIVIRYELFALQSDQGFDQRRVAILVRNELFLNVLYRILVKIFSLSQVPIAIKNGVTSALLHIGGIHAGCAVASVVWLTIDVFHPLPTGSLRATC